MEDLNELRKIAEAATPGPWEMRDENPQMDGRNFTLRVQGKAGIRMSAHCYGFNGDPEFIATFDPPTILALITRLEQAEENLESALEANKRWAHRSSRERSELFKAEQAVARVREVVANLEDHSRPRTAHKFAVAENLRRALDGDTRG